MAPFLLIFYDPFRRQKRNSEAISPNSHFLRAWCLPPPALHLITEREAQPDACKLIRRGGGINLPALLQEYLIIPLHNVLTLK